MDASAREINANTGTVRPFRVTFSDSDLDQLRRRIKATRLPETASRLYRANKTPFFAPKGVTLPTAVSKFPDELYQAPRSWAERAYPSPMYFNKVAKGGHFAAWEQPGLFTEELRAGLRPLRRH